MRDPSISRINGNGGRARGKALSRGEFRGLVMCLHHVMLLASLGISASDGVRVVGAGSAGDLINVPTLASTDNGYLRYRAVQYRR